MGSSAAAPLSQAYLDTSLQPVGSSFAGSPSAMSDLDAPRIHLFVIQTWIKDGCPEGGSDA